MATPHQKKSRPLRTVITFVILIGAIFGLVGVGTVASSAAWTPKLGLDLVGGTQIILTPRATDGSRVDADAINQAIEIIRQRVDSSGVAEAEITSQGSSNIVISLPGQPDQRTLDLVRQSAQMRFRPVLEVGSPMPVEDTATGEDESTDDPITPEAPSVDTPADEGDDEPTVPPTSGSDLNWITNSVRTEFNELNCLLPENLTGGGGDDAAAPLVTCDQTGQIKYILGPVEIEGYRISSASAQQETTQAGTLTGGWLVAIEFDSEGTKLFDQITGRLTGMPSPRNQFAMVLDGLVVSAPVSQVHITDGKATITGNFTRQDARDLANQLKFGALPLDFEVQTERQISATLGSEQLEKGLLAGVIGLLLVVVYSFLQYRVLSVVTLTSLLVAGTTTYGLITLLSWVQGYRLSLAGVTGLIVAIGIIADSFIVYFERIRDELRDGNTLEVAVDRGWQRARRTILASDAVNFLAAAVLYYLAVGGVQGFAFTLGLTTVVDLLVVFFFTHPIMKILAKTRFFGEGHPWSGLSPQRLGVEGARYVGRGRIVRGEERADRSKRTKTAKQVGSLGASSGLTLAERKALAERAEPDDSVTEESTAAEELEVNQEDRS